MLKRRTLSALLSVNSISCIHLPWRSNLPDEKITHWAGLGSALVEAAQRCDAGKAAFDECCTAREQLEYVLHGMGYDMNVYTFGGLVTMGIFEVGGDADFVGISDVEPAFEESGEIIMRVSRELRRFGMKSKSFPKARVPVLKADRASRSLPGSPFHHLARDGLFQFERPVSPSEAKEFEERVCQNYGCASVEWNSSFQFATIQFSSTSALVYALSHLKKHSSMEIPLRLPVDPRHGPEIFRFPFDFCLSATGLKNSYLLSECLQEYPFSRHLLLVLKKWGHASGVINSIDGLLASYALTVMLAHFLAVVKVIPRISPEKIAAGPGHLSPDPVYRPLLSCTKEEAADVGFLLAAFFEYYGHVFNYEENVVCTTNLALTKERMKWNIQNSPGGKPPFFAFAVKDPYGLDNIARNLDAESVQFVRKSNIKALDGLVKDFMDGPFAVNNLAYEPQKVERRDRTLSDRGIHSDKISSDQLEARHVLSKMQFQQRKKSMEQFGKQTVKNADDQSRATSVTNNVLGWIRSDTS